MANTVETLWRLILDPKETREGESTIQRLARLVKEKLGVDGAKAIDKTTEAIKDQTEALKENEEAAKKAGAAQEGIGAGDAAGKIGGAAGKLRGVGSLVGGGEGLGIINDIGDAVEGFQELGTTLASLGPVGVAAGAAILALGLVIGDFAAAAQKQADEINSAIDNMRAVADEIAGGATKEDIQESINQLQFRREMERQILAESTQAYEDFIQGIRDAFGAFAPLVEGIVKIIDPREEALKSQIDESNKLISDSEAKERAYNKALEQGLTSKADAKKAEEDRQKAAADSAREQEKAAADQKRAQDKAAADAARAAEQQAQKEKQAAEKRYQAGVKYTDALVDIAEKAADSAAASLKALREKQADNQRGFWQDIGDLSTEFQEKEREEAIKRGEEEVQDAINQARKLAQIRADAAKSEQEALRSGDYLSATRIREQANEQIEAENKALQEGQADKLRAQRSEDEAQLRELDQARRKRLLALNRANEEAQRAYRRDLDHQRDARQISMREAAQARDKELRAAAEMAQALLGIKAQQGQAELQIAQGTLNQLRGLGSVTNNNGNTMNGNITMQFSSGGGFSVAPIRSQVMSTLRSVGLVP